MENSKNKQFLSFKLQAISEQCDEISHSPSVTQPFVQCIHIVHAPCLLVT